MIHLSHDIPSGDYDRGGLASRRLKEQLKLIGASPRDIRRAMIAAYEAEMNVVIHSAGGSMNVSLDSQRLEVEVADRGPGISDIQLAMKEGYSTAPAEAREMGFGAGMGLPNIRKNSDVFGIDSTPAGTKVRFTIFLTPARAHGEYRHSLSISAGACKRCLACLRACPTRAMRVRESGPEALDYLCIDCTACIGVCESKALTVQGAAGSLGNVSGATLVLPAAAIAQFGPARALRQVLEAIRKLGFADVQVTQAAEDALRAATVEFSKEFRMGSVISPACPAVLNLIQTKFASLLPHVAPYVTPQEALASKLKGRVIFVATCPAQRALLAKLPDAPEVILPSALRAAVMPILSRRSENVVATAATTAPANGPANSVGSAPDDGVMRVTGIHHVAEVLERLENGLLEGAPVLELWACEDGCFGSPLLPEEATLSHLRCAHMPLEDAGEAAVVRRIESLSARAGLRLDEEMTKAIVKFATIAKIIETLPGRDCGMCGCPTCGAMAEDIVMGRAVLASCPYLSGKGRRS